MSRDSKYLERGPGELVLFAITFIGLVITAAGIVTTTFGAMITGFAIVFVAVACFVLLGAINSD